MKDITLRFAQGSVSDAELALLSGYLREHSGIEIPPEKSYLFETRLSKMMANIGADTFTALYDHILSGADPLARQQVIDAMTTNETLWFRDASPWKVLEQRILPRLVEELRAGRKEKIRVWFAASSTGQEAYSTAMCIDTYLKEHGIEDVCLSDFELLATDISCRVLHIAKKGRYDAISIRRGLSERYRDAYFVKDGSAWDLDARIRDAVQFRPFNLLRSFAPLGSFDIIFCRYVLIYFAQELKRDILRKAAGALTEDGVLFTGNYALCDLFEDWFEARLHENMTYYFKKGVKE